GVAVDATSSTGATVTVSVDGAAPVAPPVTVSGDGAHVVNASASDGATATAVILVDTTPPALTLPSHIYVGDSVPLSTICTDSGSGIKTCSGTQNGATLDSTHSLNTAHAGPINLVLHATDNAGNTAQLVKTVTPAVNWPQPASIVFGTKLGSAQLDATSPVPGKFVYTPAAGTVLQPGQQTLSVTFTPTSTADYLPVTTTVSIKVLVNQACITTSQSGPITVSSGKVLCVTAGGKLTGPITVQSGGSLYIIGGTVTGPITATSASAITLCKSSVTGPVSITSATGYVLLGGVAATGCAGNTITGPVTLTKNA